MTRTKVRLRENEDGGAGAEEEGRRSLGDVLGARVGEEEPLREMV